MRVPVETVPAFFTDTGADFATFFVAVFAGAAAPLLKFFRKDMIAVVPAWPLSGAKRWLCGVYRHGVHD